MDKTAISPDAIARAILFAIEQPADVDVGEIIVRPTAQSWLDAPNRSAFRIPHLESLPQRLQRAGPREELIQHVVD
jgi:hypothetical protein